MNITATVEILNSRRDTFGNCYWAFRYIDHASGVEVCATSTGGESNTRAIAFGWSTPGQWDNSLRFTSNELKIREFNRLVKSWPHAGCDPQDIAAFIRAAIINELATRGR